MNWPFQHDRGCRHVSAEILLMLAGRSFSPVTGQPQHDRSEHATLPTADEVWWEVLSRHSGKVALSSHAICSNGYDSGS